MKKYNFDLGIKRRGTDAKKYNPSLCPEDVLPFWIADTDFPSPDEVKEAVQKRLDDQHYGYPYISDSFEKSIARWYKVRHGLEIDSGLIDFSPCVIPAMIWFVLEFSAPGDKVLLQTPVYPPFHDLIRNNGRNISYNSLKLVNGRYEIDWEDLEKKLSCRRCKILFICNPQNPTGRNFSKEELERMGQLALKYDVKVGVDEIHADIVYDGKKFVCFSGISEELAMNSVTFLNPAKTFNVAGFRTAAWFTHNPKIYKAMIKQQANAKGMGRTIFGTVATEACFNHCDDYADALVEYLNETKNQLVKYVSEEISDIDVIPTEATFMAWLDCRKLGFETQAELERFMFEEAKVLLSSGTTFGEKDGFGFMRFNFAAPRAQVMEGLKRIKEAVDRLQN